MTLLQASPRHLLHQHLTVLNSCPFWRNSCTNPWNESGDWFVCVHQLLTIVFLILFYFFDTMRKIHIFTSTMPGDISWPYSCWQVVFSTCIEYIFGIMNILIQRTSMLLIFFFLVELFLWHIGINFPIDLEVGWRDAKETLSCLPWWSLCTWDYGHGDERNTSELWWINVCP
jgi:hypothetical protein